MKYGKLIAAAVVSFLTVAGNTDIRIPVDVKAEEVNASEVSDAGLRGDLNGDGIINVLDLIRCVNIFLEGTKPDDVTVYRADVNGDDVINTADLVALKKYLLGTGESDPAASVKFYRAVGTGKEREDDYKPDARYSYYTYDYRIKDNYLNFIKDKDFQKTINREISAAAKGHNIEDVHVEVINGYMSVLMLSGGKEQYIPEKGYTQYSYSYVCSLNYDLRNQKKIENLSDLFYKGEDFVPLLNNSIGTAVNLKYSDFLKREFTEITDTGGNFTIGGIIFENNGYYSDDALIIPFSNNTLFDWRAVNYDGYVIDDSMVIWEYFDNNKVLDDKKCSLEPGKAEWYETEEPDQNGDIRVTVNGSRFHTDSEVAGRQAAYDRVFEAAKKIRSEEYGDESASIKIKDSLMSYGDYLMDGNSLKVMFVNYELTDDFYDTRFMFDQNTGERVFLSDIFGKIFEKYDHEKLYINDLDVLNGMVEFVTDSDTMEKMKLSFDVNEADMDYLVTSKDDVFVYDFETPLTGLVIGHAQNNERVYGMPSSYILDYGPKINQWEITGNWNVISKRKCYSHGKVWFDCYDADDGDYYGWVLAAHTVF